MYAIVIILSANGIIKNERVANAMKAVDRANFIKNNPYIDSPQGIGYAVTISAPHMVSTFYEFSYTCVKRI